ncbi:MAG TPA: EamA family transporter [Sphingomonas sp.]|jgi:inner membrane transporter RhtA|nr:EamA family transporter [Sphingomonas sp.]
MTQSRRAGLAPLALIASMVSLCVGTSYAKALFPVAGAGGMTALRIGLSMLLLVAVQRPWRWRLSAVQARAVIGYGVVLALMNLSFYAAVARLPLGIAIAIEFLGPLSVAVLGSARRTDLVWVALAIAGVAMLVMAPDVAGRAIDPVGVVFALLAAIGWALYIIGGKHASAVVPEGQIVCLGLCAAAVIAVPVGVMEAGRVLLDPHVLAIGALVALLCSAIPYSLELFALKRMPAATFGILVSMEPAIGALAALVVLGESIAVRQWLGIAAVVAASVGSIVTAARAPVVAPPVPLPG